jgi:hypothetical protein
MRLSRSIGDAVDLDDSAHGTVLWAWPHRTVHRLTFIAVMSQRLALLSPEVAADNDGSGSPPPAPANPRSGGVEST